MAKIQRDFNSMGLPMNITRGNPIPLDSTEIYYSLPEAQEYASNGATAYVGQLIVVVDETNNSSTVYLIKNEAGDLEEISSGSDLQWKSI